MGSAGDRAAAGAFGRQLPRHADVRLGVRAHCGGHPSFALRIPAQGDWPVVPEGVQRGVGAHLDLLRGHDDGHSRHIPAPGVRVPDTVGMVSHKRGMRGAHASVRGGDHVRGGVRVRGSCAFLGDLRAVDDNVLFLRRVRGATASHGGNGIWSDIGTGRPPAALQRAHLHGCCAGRWSAPHVLARGGVRVDVQLRLPRRAQRHGDLPLREEG